MAVPPKSCHDLRRDDRQQMTRSGSQIESDTTCKNSINLRPAETLKRVYLKIVGSNLTRHQI
jgi:hypothetical protein